MVVADFLLNCDMISKLGLQMWTEHIRINPKNNLPVRYYILTDPCYYISIINPFICGLEGYNVITGRNLAGAPYLLEDNVVLPLDFAICQLGACHSLPNTCQSFYCVIA